MKTMRIAFFIASALLLLASCFLLPMGEEDYLVKKGLIDPILTDGTPIALKEGSLDPQWFTLHAVSGSVYRLGFSNKEYATPSFAITSNLDLALYASDKTTLIATKSDAFMVFIPQATGDYSVRASSSSRSLLAYYGVYMEANATTALGEDIWANGSLQSDQSAWYRFNGVEGVKYFIQWNDEYDGDNSKTARLEVSAYGVGPSAPIFSEQTYGYDAPREITATANGPIVLLLDNIDFVSGTYAIKYFEADPPAALTDGAWADGVLVSNFASWYSFEAVAGEMYNINWNSADYYYSTSYGDNTKTAIIKVDAYHADRTTEYFPGDEYGAYVTPRTIVATETGTIYLRVTKMLSYYDAGTFGIRYRHVVPIALTDDVWLDTTITTGDIHWYSFPVTAGEPYYVNWNEFGGSPNGDDSKMGNVTVTAFASDRTTAYFTDVAYAYDAPREIVPTASGTIYLKVTAQSAGTFAIRSRHGTTTSLVDNVWADGTIATGDILWYSFLVTAGEPYYVNWNEIGGTDYGDGSKTGNVTVTAYASDRTTAYFTNIAYSYATPQEIVPSASGTVFLKVVSSGAGTFAIRSRHGTTTSLSDNVWSNGTIAIGDLLWYSFAATAGRVYDIAWNESGNAPYGDGTMTGNLTLSVYAADRTTPYYATSYNAFTTPLSVIASATEQVYIKVIAAGAGTYALRFRETAIPTPLSDNAWMPGTISDGETLWYSFPVERGERYYVNWNEVGSASHGDNTQSGDIAVSGYSNGTLNTSFTNGDYAFTSNRIMDVSIDGTAYLKVTANTPPGTFQIRYRKSATIPLSDNVWMDGTLVSGEDAWYSFPCIAGEIYNVFLNRAGTGDNGDGTQTAFASMSGYKVNRSDAYFGSITYAFINPEKVYATENGWVFIRITNGPGTYRVRYTTIPTTALTQGVAYQDSLLTGEIKGYSFPATAGTTYSIVLDDSWTNIAYTCHVYVSASLGGTYLFTYGSISQSFTVASSGTVKIYVGGYNSSPGTFAIRYTSP